MNTKTSIIIALGAMLFFSVQLHPLLDSFIFVSHNECLTTTIWGDIAVAYCWFLLLVLWPCFVYGLCKSVLSFETYFGIPKRPTTSLILVLFTIGLFVFIFYQNLFEPENCPQAQLTIYGHVYVALLAIVLPLSNVFGTSSLLNIVSRLLNKNGN